MRRIDAVGIALLLLVGATGVAIADTAGSYRCVAVTGTIDESSVTVPLVMHYNPNSISQSIRQIQIFDAEGVLFYDSGAIPVGEFVVPPRGSSPVAFLMGELGGGVQVIVRWSQGSDKKPPIARLNLFHSDETVTYIRSASQSNCP
jgi:hypothetical protein